MRELNMHDRQILKEFAVHQNIKQKLNLGKKLIPRGHKMFQVEVATGIMTQCKIEEIVDMRNNIHVPIRRLELKEGFWYENALNMNNAERKFKKRLKKFINEHK